MTISFERRTKGPIVRSGFLTNGWFRDHSANPSLVLKGDYVYMFFRGIANGQPSTMGVWRIHRENFNGKDWDKTWSPNAVLLPTSGSQDATGILDPHVVLSPNGSEFWCYYMAVQGQNAYVMRARSTDGLTWTKDGVCFAGSNPGVIISPDGKTHVFSGGPTGNGGYQYYHLVSNNGLNGWSTGSLAFAPSGIAGSFDEYSVVTIRMLYEAPYYYMFFGGCPSGFSDYPEGIGVARSTSLDGPWERSPANPILLRGASGSWDEGGLWSASVMRISNQLLMVYEGVGTNTLGGTSASNSARDTQYGGYNTTSFSQVGVAIDASDGNLLDWFPSETTLPNGRYYIRNMLTGKFLTPVSSVPVTGTRVVQSSADRISDAIWHIEKIGGFYRISSAKAGNPGSKVLEMGGGSRENLGVSDVWDANGLPNQQWHLTKVAQAKNGAGHYEIVNRYSGQSLEPWEMKSSDGVPIRQMPSLAQPHQRWEIIAVPQ